MTKESLTRYSAHLGSILFKISIFGVLFIIGILFTPIMFLIIVLILSLVAIYSTLFSAGTVWLVEPFKAFMVNSFKILFSEKFLNTMNSLVTNTPVFVTITAIVMALSILFLSFDRKNRGSKNKIITIIVLVIILIIVSLCILFGIRIGG